jgi:hypothetical protein
MKSLDALERLYIAGRFDLPYVMNGQQQKDYETIEKNLKVLEIIKNKILSIDMFYLNAQTLTTDELNLIKEWLTQK